MQLVYRQDSQPLQTDRARVRIDGRPCEYLPRVLFDHTQNLVVIVDCVNARVRGPTIFCLRDAAVTLDEGLRG